MRIPEAEIIIMFKMLVLQLLNDLSDFELEKQCIDRIYFRKFLGFPEYIPDSTTSDHSEKELLITVKKKNLTVL